MLLTLGVCFLTLVGSVFFFKDRLIKQFILEANKNLSTPIDIGKIDVSWFEDFPHLSIVFHDVYVEDSHAGQYPLLTASVISFQLNVYDAWHGQYTIKGLQLREAEANLKINESGENNYTIVKTDTTAAHSGGTIAFALNNVLIKSIRFHFIDLSTNKEFTFLSNKLAASIRTADDIYDIEAAGELMSEKIKIKQTEVFGGKLFAIDSRLTYDDIHKSITINPSDLTLRNSTFTVSGQYSWQDTPHVDLQANASDTDIQTLLSLLPEATAQSLEKYRSKGEMYFNARLKGDIAEHKDPALTAEFGFHDATLYHPDYHSRIEQASLTGSFASSNITDPQQGILILKDIQGTLNGNAFQANLSVHNFKDSDIQLQFKGALDAAAIVDFYPIEQIADVKGDLLVDISFEGRLSWLKNKATAKRTSTKGSIELKNLSFKFGEGNVPVHELNGVLQFNNNDLALSDVTAKLGNSDFLLNGFFKNVITFLLFENQPIGIETDLKSNFLDLDELLALGFGKKQTGQSAKDSEYEFSISPNINLNFNCDVKSLRYKHFHAQNLNGDLLVKDRTAVSRRINMQTMGGTLTFSAIVDAHNPKAIDIVNTSKLNGIYIDSVFYVFENFNQNFIEDKHLKGQAYADVNLEMALNPNLRLFSETLVADIGLVIKNGELNELEPIQKLDRYLDDRGLHHVRFSDLKNDIHIENKTIYIPQMEVSSNVTSIMISGTHTFDQLIDYRLITPLRSHSKVSAGEAGDALQPAGQGQSKLYLKIVGTTDNYRILYDTEAVKKKIVNDIKQEVQELKDAFKNKGQEKQKDLELEKDEYFDWDE